mgnify:CR=1 FL=1
MRYVKKFSAWFAGIIALVGFITVVTVSSASAATCDNSAGYVMDDGVCGYIHPDDRTIAVLSSINELKELVDQTNNVLWLIAWLLVIIAVVVLVWASMAIARIMADRDEEKEDTEDLELI